MPKMVYIYQVNITSYTSHKILSCRVGWRTSEHDEKRLQNTENTMPLFVNPKDVTQSLMYCEEIGLYIFISSMCILYFYQVWVNY